MEELNADKCENILCSVIRDEINGATFQYRDRGNGLGLDLLWGAATRGWLGDKHWASCVSDKTTRSERTNKLEKTCLCLIGACLGLFSAVYVWWLGLVLLALRLVLFTHPSTLANPASLYHGRRQALLRTIHCPNGTEHKMSVAFLQLSTECLLARLTDFAGSSTSGFRACHALRPTTLPDHRPRMYA